MPIGKFHDKDSTERKRRETQNESQEEKKTHKREHKRGQAGQQGKRRKKEKANTNKSQTKRRRTNPAEIVPATAQVMCSKLQLNIGTKLANAKVLQHLRRKVSKVCT